MKTIFIMGFEGASLSGKTTAITYIQKSLNASGTPTLRIGEYIEYADGQANFPNLIPTNEIESLNSANYFIELETLRMKDIALWSSAYSGTSPAIILVDRLLFTCLAVRKSINDMPGYNLIMNAIQNQKYIEPDLTIFLASPDSESEYNRRLKTRILFEHWEIIYGLNNPLNSSYKQLYDWFVNEIKPLKTIYTDSSQLDAILRLIKRYFLTKNPGKNVHFFV